MARIADDDDPATASTEAAASGFAPMEDLRPGAPAGLQLARARVFGALFGHDGTVGTFGRLRVLERLGAGGMGVVYEAYDPDLARGVALKLVNVTVKDRETALAEAKALARLSHPNVVPIYDVGIESEHVYLVMELVRGQTLRDWPKLRMPREVLAVYRQAGLALVAAHAAGLVHRDFKPDNAIVGADGRVRVVDFGLACEADDPARATGEPRRAAGTPRFMAPEIKAGMAVTPAADQYSFCVALAQALELAHGGSPRHLAAAIERGRAADPADRFPSMAELLRILERDPARTRRRVAYVSGLAASIGAIAFFLGQRNAGEADTCDDGAARLEAAWSRSARAAALDRLATLGAYGQSLRPLLQRGLDDHAQRWVAQYRSACLESHRGTESDALIDRRTTCLHRGSDALAAVGALIAHADPTNLPELPRAVQSMPDPEQCADRDVLLSDISPPPPEHAAQVAHARRQIEQARIDVGAGRYEQALAEARTAVAEARGLEYEPALAEALLVQGHARSQLDGRIAAVPPLAEATRLAVSSHADALAIEAWARRAWAQGTGSDPDGAGIDRKGALAGLDLIEPLAQRTPAAAFARALLYNNLGSIEIARDDRDRARAYLEHALTVARTVTGPGALELVSIRENLAFVTDDREYGDKLLVDAATELAGKLGEDHPDALKPRLQRGFVTVEDLRTVDVVLTPVCRAHELHPTLADRTAECWTEVGFVRAELGERDRAIEAMERAAVAPNEASEAGPYVPLLQGDPRAAAQRFADALAATPAKPNDEWWDRLVRAKLTLGLGRARRDLGDLRSAREALQAAIADLDPIVRKHHSISDARRLGRARVELAFTLFASGASSSECTEAAAAAVAWLRHVGGTPTEIALLSTGDLSWRIP